MKNGTFCFSFETKIMPLRIAIQGIRGSNHHQVVKEYYGDDVDLVECLSFHGLVDRLLNGEADKGVMAIEKFDCRVHYTELCPDR